MRPGINFSNSEWNKPGAVELLQKLAADGRTATGITLGLNDAGVIVSRNAVIGKMARLGLKLRAARAANPRPKPQRVRRQTIEKKPEVPDDAASFKKRLAQAFSGEGPPLDQITAGLCVWPLDIGFCGHGIEPGQSYCSGHCDMAYPARHRAAA